MQSCQQVIEVDEAEKGNGDADLRCTCSGLLTFCHILWVFSEVEETKLE